MDKLHNSSAFRYNIRSRIKSMPKNKQAIVRQKVLEDSGMCRSSYYKVLTLKHTDTSDIPAKMLLAFSKALDVEMEELFNKE